MFRRLSNWWYGSQAKPAATTSHEEKPKAPAHTSTHATVTASATAKKPAPKPAPQNVDTDTNSPVITPPDATPAFDGDTQELVDQHLQELATIQLNAQKNLASWEQIKADLGKQGADEEVVEQDTNHGIEAKGFFATLAKIAKENVQAAQSYMEGQMHGPLGMHITDLHAQIKAQLDLLEQATDAKKKLQLKLAIANLSIDLDTEREAFAKSIQEELQSCERDIQYVSLGVNIIFPAIIRAITTLPIPTPDFRIPQNYKKGLSDRTKQAAIEEDQKEAALAGTEARAFADVLGDGKDIPAAPAAIPSTADSDAALVASPARLFNKPAAASSPARSASVEHKNPAQDAEIPASSPSLRRLG